MADFEIEKDLICKGIKDICGIDEVGRGALFGPVVAGAVIMDPGSVNEKINDSKKLSPGSRKRMAKIIYEESVSYSTGWAWPREIDRNGIVSATRSAMKMAVKNLQIKPCYVLIDAMDCDFLGISGESIVKGDEKSISIAAASIIAKVFRDDLMVLFSEYFPNYALERNKGYLTRDHYNAIRSYGISGYHRRSFKVEKWQTKD